MILPAAPPGVPSLCRPAPPPTAVHSTAQIPEGIAVWTPLAVAVHEAAAWAVPGPSRTVVEIATVVAATRPALRRNDDAERTSDSQEGWPGSPGAEVRGRTSAVLHHSETCQ